MRSLLWIGYSQLASACNCCLGYHIYLHFWVLPNHQSQNASFYRRPTDSRTNPFFDTRLGNCGDLSYNFTGHWNLCHAVCHKYGRLYRCWSQRRSVVRRRNNDRNRNGAHHRHVYGTKWLHWRLCCLSYGTDRRWSDIICWAYRFHCKTIACTSRVDDSRILRKTLRSQGSHCRRDHIISSRYFEHGIVFTNRRKIHCRCDRPANRW